jgi:hypothetical protein
LSTVPYTFATASGNVPASQLDANFANVKASADSAGIVTNPVQPIITTVGVLTELSVAGNVTASYFLGNILGSVSNALYANNANVATTANSATTVTGASQLNITQVGTMTVLSVIGNVDGGNLRTVGGISATGTITGLSFIGNGSQLTGITATAGAAITNGTSNVTVAASSNTTVGVAGTTVATFASTGIYAPGIVSATGNVTGGNLRTAGQVSATGNVTGSYILGNGSQLTGLTGISASSNAALLTGDTLSSNVVNSSLTSVGTLGMLSVAGNVYTDKIVATGNIYGDNILSTGNIALNGSDIITSAANLGIGTQVANGYIRIGNTKPAEISIGGNTANMTLTLGNTTSTVQIPGTITSGNITAGNIINNGLTTVTGNITGANINTGGIVSATGNISSAGNIAGNYILGNASYLTSAGQSFAVTNANATAYIFNGSTDDPTINLTRGQTYYFNMNVGSTHPMWIKTAPTTGTGNAYSTGVTNNGIVKGQITFQVPWEAPSLLYYQCQLHAGMGGLLQIVDGTMLQNGNSNVTVYGNGNVTTTVNNTSNVTVVTSSGLLISGTASATGDITGGNILTSGLISSTGNVTANNFIGGGAGTPTVSATTNLILSAGTSVQVTGGGTFRLPTLTTAQIANIIAANGDMVYNSSTTKIQAYANGAWGNITLT